MSSAAAIAIDPVPPLASLPLSPGVRLGKFEIVREFASGGMGRIYVAHDTITGVAVALKVLIPAADPEPGRLERFKRESLICKQLAHPNIIRIFDIDEDAGFYFISMELLQGRDLRALLDSEPLPELDWIYTLSLQVLAGLEFAHAQSIVHRDFKPQNIFVMLSGQVKLLDFGVSQALTISSHTTPGSMVGTPGYISPEQAQGKRDIDGRADIYSLGVVLYEMLTGRLPFRGESPIGVAAAHVYETPPPIRDVSPEVPKKLALVVMRCLEKAPSARYANVAALRAALTAAARDAGVPVDAIADALAKRGTPTPSPVDPEPQNGVVTKVLPRRIPRSPVTASSRISRWVLGGAVGLVAAVVIGASPQALALCNRARLALARNDLDAASKDLKWASALGPQLNEVHQLLAELDMKLGENEAAADQLKAVLARSPGDSIAAILLADLLKRERLLADTERQKRIDELVKELSKPDALTGGALKDRAPRDPWTSRPRTIWMLEIEHGAELRPGYALALQAALEESLVALPGTYIVERDLIEKLLTELTIAKSPLADPSKSLERGKLISARFIIRAVLNSLDDRATLQWKVIDVETSEDVARDSLTIDTAANPNDAAAEAAKEIDRKLLERYPVRGRVKEVRPDGTLLLNVGSEVGLRVGSAVGLFPTQSQEGVAVLAARDATVEHALITSVYAGAATATPSRPLDARELRGFLVQAAMSR